RVNSLLSHAVSSPTSDILSAYTLLSKEAHASDALLGQLADAATHNRAVLSKDRQISAIYVYFRDADAITSNYPAIQAILADQKAQFAPLEATYLLGSVEIKHALNEALLHDCVYLMPLVLLSGLVLLYFFLRSWWLVFSGIVSIVVALWITAGIAGSLGFVINQTSGLAFAIAFIVSLADIIHLLMSYSRHQMVNNSNIDTMMESMHGNVVALFLTSITIAIGFISLGVGDSPVFTTFGYIATIGVICSFATAVTITPVLAVRIAPPNSAREPDIFQHLVRRIWAIARDMKGPRAWAFYGISFFLSAGMLLSDFHNDPLEYFDSSTPIRQAVKVSEQYFDTHYPITIQIDSGHPDGIFDPAFIDTMTRFQSWLEARPEISYQTSFLDHLQLLKRNLHESNAKWSATPINPHEIADLWNLYEMSSANAIPQAIGLNDELSAATMVAGVPKMRSHDLINLEQAIRAWFADNAPNATVGVTGHSVLFAVLGYEVTLSMFLSGLTSGLVISLLLGIFLGSFRLGIVAMIPNTIPGTVIFGLWGGTVNTIDIAAAGTFSIGLGIVVDDTVHILSRHIRNRRAGMSPLASLEAVLEETGSALVLTTVVLSCGMGILIFSIFGPNQTMAILMATNILIALAYDFLMMPHMLVILDKWIFPNYAINENAAVPSVPAVS
ncbi:MAG TPA: MMPL family transporter, partial [Dongiaceae bacterium]|nr:MMPL family transporter [Dongiaceae bacterium]